MNRSTRALVPLAGAVLALGLAVTPALASGTPGTCSTAAPVPTGAPSPNSGTGTNNGGDCQVEGSATIASTMAFEVGVSSFSFPGGVSATRIDPSTAFQVYVSTNTPNYYVTDAITSAFTGAEGHSNTLAPQDFLAGVDGASTGCHVHPPTESQQPYASDNTGDGLSAPFTVVSIPCSSSGWNYQNSNSTVTGDTGMPATTDEMSVDGWSFTSSAMVNPDGTQGASAPADTYSGDVTLALWG